MVSWLVAEIQRFLMLATFPSTTEPSSMSDLNSSSTNPSAAQRRTLKFQTLDDILADAERVAVSSPTTLGNWSPGQIFMHLARGLDLSIDGAPPLPWYVRFVGSMFLKQRFLTRAMQPGWKLPAKNLLPGETTTAAGLNALRGAMGRMKSSTVFKPHPIFGPLTGDEWIALHCRHAELHLGFLLPAGCSSDVAVTAGQHSLD